MSDNRTASTLAGIMNPQSWDDTAVIVPGGPTVTYAELRDEVEDVAELLAGAGVAPGRAVSIALPNGLDFLVAFLAVDRADAVAAPLNPAYTTDEFKFFMGDINAQFAILPQGEDAAHGAAQALGVPTLDESFDGTGMHLYRDGRLLSAHRDAPPPAPDDIALFLHTSGTTSRPKAVPLTHGNLTASVKNIAGTYELTPDDTAMVVMPLFHVHGLIGVALSTLYTGGTLVIPPRFSASRFWGEQASSGATWYSAVPTIHQILLARAEDDDAPRGAFRFIRSCSSALAPAVFDKLEARFDAPVLEAYGMTEASHQMSSNPLPPGDRAPGTVGKGTGVDIAIMDDGGALMPNGELGEIAVMGGNVTRGYHNNPQANADAFTGGWFRTGDQGFLDERGVLTLTGRLKELINRAGEKISPLEIDAVLLQRGSVAEAVCFGVPDEKYGEAVQAAVVLSGDDDETGIRAYCAERLTGFKVPDRVHIVDSLPRAATGKLQRRHIAAMFAE